jgi:hypothetical protein
MMSVLLNTKGESTKGDDMKNIDRLSMIRVAGVAKTAWRLWLGMWLVAGCTSLGRAQGQIASGTISSSGAGPYTYSLSFSDAANASSPIGSVWYAWVPGAFYLPGAPTSASAPAGWTATIFGNSVQYVANSPANDITAGSSLSGFSYQAAFTPGQLAAAPNSGVSVAYSGGLFSDGGDTFTVQPAVVPEPSVLTLLSGGAIGLCVAGCRGLRRLRI